MSQGGSFTRGNRVLPRARAGRMTLALAFERFYPDGTKDAHGKPNGEWKPLVMRQVWGRRTELTNRDLELARAQYHEADVRFETRTVLEGVVKREDRMYVVGREHTIYAIAHVDNPELANLGSVIWAREPTG